MPEVREPTEEPFDQDRTARILFLCTGNSCRSQMAEALGNAMGQGRLRCVSAGQQPQSLHALAIASMAQVGFDISQQQSKPIALFQDASFDFVITLCERVREACPSWPDARQQIHWSIEDPAQVTGSEEERLRAFRQAREAIRQRLQLFILANRLVPR